MNTQRLHQTAQPIFVTEVYIMHDDAVLMFKRSNDRKKFPGFWSLPGGHVDKNEDPLSAAIREVKEETGVIISTEKIKLKVIAMHHHIDRKEMYVAFAFVTRIPTKPKIKEDTKEGTPKWVKIEEMKKIENVFEPVQYYFDHILNNKPGIIYNNSEWKNNKLVRVLSETIDSDY